MSDALNSPPVVCVGSPGRFHTFDLAVQLARQGALACVYTAYPRARVEPFIRARTRAFPPVLLAREGIRRAGFGRLANSLDKAVTETFDRWVARELRPCDLYHCLSGFGLRTYGTARRHGARLVCDRGSTHIQMQDRLLREEYERWDIPFQGVPAWAIERELAEYEMADAIVVPSTFVRDSFLAQGVAAEKVHAVPFGVDLSLFRPSPKGNGAFRALFAGQVCVRKGIGDLLAAMASDRVLSGNVEVWLAGAVNPEVEPVLSGHTDFFRLLGHVPRTRLAEIFAQSSVLVLPSIEEGLALVLAQAMACGLPVIATDRTGAADLFTDGVEGFIVPARQPDILAERIGRLRSDPELRDAMGRAALVRARELRGWEEYGDRMREAYRWVLSGSRA